jgi:hypothetical protein
MDERVDVWMYVADEWMSEWIIDERVDVWMFHADVWMSETDV